MTKIKICGVCGGRSLPGLSISPGLCQYHYNERMWGTGWADHVYNIPKKETNMAKKNVKKAPKVVNASGKLSDLWAAVNAAGQLQFSGPFDGSKESVAGQVVDMYTSDEILKFLGLKIVKFNKKLAAQCPSGD